MSGGVSDEQLTEAQWAEIDLHIKYTPEWTGGPDYAYWAMADRTLLLGEVRAARAREADLRREVESLDDYICDLTMLGDSVVPPVLKDRLHRFIDRRRSVPVNE